MINSIPGRDVRKLAAFSRASSKHTDCPTRLHLGTYCLPGQKVRRVTAHVTRAPGQDMKPPLRAPCVIKFDMTQHALRTPDPFLLFPT
jgi:hypothetical protein